MAKKGLRQYGTPCRGELIWQPAGSASAILRDSASNQLCSYEWSESRNNPSFHPVYTGASGSKLTDRPEGYYRWHHGLWWSWKFINEYLFWEDIEDPGEPHRGLGHAVVHNHAVQADGAGGLHIDQELQLRAAGEVLLDEVRRLKFAQGIGVPGDGWMIDWELDWTARVDCEFRVTEGESWGGYAGLAFRAAPSMADGEKIIAADGRVGVDRVHGAAVRWAALSGRLDDSSETPGTGPSHGGIAMLSHPTNSRFPTPVFAKSANVGSNSFGFLAASPIFHDRLSLAAGQRLRFRFRVLVYPGHSDSERLERAWDAYAAMPAPC